MAKKHAVISTKKLKTKVRRRNQPPGRKHRKTLGPKDRA